MAAEMTSLCDALRRDALDYIETNPDDHASRLIAGLLTERDYFIRHEGFARERCIRLEQALKRLSSHLSIAGGIDLMCSRSPVELRRELDARGQYAADALGTAE